MNWEYRILDQLIGATEDLTVQLAALGSLGWEAVGYTCIIQLGPNIASVLLKRPILELAPPEDLKAGWYPDPAGRFELRHWDGVRWSEHVASGGKTETDYPNVRPAAG